MTTTNALMSEKMPSGLLSRYHPSSDTYDEMLDQTGAVRPHWRKLIDAIDALGPENRRERSNQINRRVRNVGIAHDIFSNPDDTDQPWNLDLVPFIISASEWRWLEAALMQRARLYNAVLADVYGEQRLMRQGLIPPELVFADPSFLPSCHAISSPRGHLQFLAIDLARAANGQWRVIDSHAETTAGLGFALANRMVHTQFAGDLLSDCKASRFAPYFTRLQSELIERTGRPDPQIALLTKGPHHEDYFSHAYMARYLGHILVEGGDLRIVGDRVHLKTLEGLKPIDLIVRCIEGGNADPLELNPAGFDGPVGLVQACRANPDLVINALGSAVIENRALGAYLPQLSEDLLNEPLSLPDAPRWWLGETRSRQHVLDTPAKWILRKTHEGTGRPGRASVGIHVEHDGSPASIERFNAQIDGQATTMVAEEPLSLATTPSLSPNGLHPVPSAIRLFVSLTQDGYAVMPGGLSMSVKGSKAVSLSADEHTRDIWVLTDARTLPHTSLWRNTMATARTDRSHRVLQSRVADNLFWLGRYAERSDWTMRMLRGAVRRLYEEDVATQDGLFAARICLARLLARDTPDQIPPPSVDDQSAVRHLISHLLNKDKSDFGLFHTLQSLHQTAYSTRDRLSLEAWQTLNTLNAKDLWPTSGTPPKTSSLPEFLDNGLLAIAAFNGLMHENMTRNFGWTFLDMGRRLERAYNLCDAIVGLFPQYPGDAHENSELLLLLELADSYITYRSRYRLDPMLHLVLDLLMHDETNPRSIAFQLGAISKHLKKLPLSETRSDLTEEQRIILSLHANVQLFDNETLAIEGNRSKLHELLQIQLNQLPQLSEAIMHRYFNPKEDTPHQAHMRFETTK